MVGPEYGVVSMSVPSFTAQRVLYASAILDTSARLEVRGLGKVRRGSREMAGNFQEQFRKRGCVLSWGGCCALDVGEQIAVVILAGVGAASATTEQHPRERCGQVSDMPGLDT